MNVVVLDGYTLNPGDLSWNKLEELGNLTVYDRTPVELIVERAQSAEIVLTNKTRLTAHTINSLPHLQYIGVLATGFNVVDIQAAKERGVPVVNIPDYGTSSVAQSVFALILELTNQVKLHSDAVFQGEWTSCPDFCFTKTPLMELEGKTLGVIGYGRIGQAVAKIADAFGMEVLFTARSQRNDANIGRQVELKQLLRDSDIISLHCPLTEDTQGLINQRAIEQMKPSAFLINTSRGPLIQEQDLADALKAGRLAGAGLDVLSVEPPSAENPLFQAPNCIITPHIAWATKEARARLMDIAVDNLQAFQNGNPQNVVNP